ncbi:hypothetical protein [Streptomyces lincolnensis]|uniref:hypothetical protein n=1 Tax=Streptomyces lincolnensis TaxID=1915 RepID=UPI0037D2BB2A
MSGLTPEITQARAKIAATERWHRDRDTGDLRRELKAAVLARHIQEFVSTAPLPTSDQLAQLRALLGGGDHGA